MSGGGIDRRSCDGFAGRCNSLSVCSELIAGLVSYQPSYRFESCPDYKKQIMKTAVEFLQEALFLHLTLDQQFQFEGLFQQALEFEKEQIIKAYQQGVTEEYGDTLDFTNDTDAEEYYNHTFKND